MLNDLQWNKPFPCHYTTTPVRQATTQPFSTSVWQRSILVYRLAKPAVASKFDEYDDGDGRKGLINAGTERQILGYCSRRAHNSETWTRDRSSHNNQGKRHDFHSPSCIPMKSWLIRARTVRLPEFHIYIAVTSYHCATGRKLVFGLKPNAFPHLSCNEMGSIMDHHNKLGDTLIVHGDNTTMGRNSTLEKYEFKGNWKECRERIFGRSFCPSMYKGEDKVDDDVIRRIYLTAAAAELSNRNG